MQKTNPAVVTFELDVGWVASAGLDPIDLLNRYKGRFRLLHVIVYRDFAAPDR